MPRKKKDDQGQIGLLEARVSTAPCVPGSQIVNDPNDWAREHNDPKYILNLLKSIITVSLETMKVVNGLPGLKERKEQI